MSELPTFVGHDTIDSLRVLQLLHDDIDNQSPDDKIRLVRASLANSDAHALLGQQFMISADQVFGKFPDAPPEELVIYRSGLTFLGTLAAYGYLYDTEIPVDSLTLNIEGPQIFEASSVNEDALYGQQLRVPILCVSMCMQM